MPWLPELFSTPALQALQDKWEHELITVPFFDGVMTGEVDALVGSFAGEPEVHHPLRGRIRGRRAFEAFVLDTKAWLTDAKISIEDMYYVIRTPAGGLGEVVIHVRGDAGPIDLPVAIVADKEPDGHIDEVRMYASGWPLVGRHVHRPPLLQPDPDVREPDVVAQYWRAFAAGDVDGIVSTFEPDGYAREPAGGPYVHRGRDGLRAFYQRLFSAGGGIPLERCNLIDDGHECALEYNVVRWGRTEVLPEAGVAVFARGESGKLAAVRIYDDVDPPLGSSG